MAVSSLVAKITSSALAGFLVYTFKQEIIQGVVWTGKFILDSSTTSLQISTTEYNTQKTIRAIKAYLNFKVSASNENIVKDGGNIPQFTLSNGTYTIKYNGRYVFIKITNDNITVWMIGNLFTTNLKFLQTFMTNIYKSYNSPDKIITFYTTRFNNGNHTWNIPNFRKPRTILMTNDMQELYNDVENFIDSENTYEQQGKAFKRGYLIIGATGTGKSAMAEIIANKKNRSVHIINLNSNKMDDTNLTNLLISVDPHSIIVFDEIEKQLKAIEGKPNINVTSGGILTALDGPQRLSHGTIVVMTANSINNWDNDFKTQLLRPGRIDKTFNFNILL